MNPNQDSLQRINFLYQAAHCMLLQNPENTSLARFYITTMKNVAKKSVLRIHPGIKRTICKRCDLLLIPGLTSKVRSRGKRQKHLVVTCIECGGVKRFVSNKDYKLWVDRPECTQNPVIAQPISEKDKQEVPG
ncbi:ribonuclease P protein subunit p21-like [Asterias rubens]|uniref:ribonuclease P protein subunit p21-like n=1 Tax=Asterias rubens TaxID=7604 RepID=UPI001455089F|nr:ribonuclease P protein subunit p21-like [Asterias rubens]